jgi:hypothetical protein
MTLQTLLLLDLDLSTKGKEYTMALGRESASESPLGHIMLNAERTIARSVKNESFGQKTCKPY